MIERRQLSPEPVTTTSKQRHGWPKGVSGNPAGRPKGARHKALVALDLVGQEAALDIMRTVVDAAKDGDMRAAELILARLWPIRKGRPVAIDLPPVSSASELPAAFASVIQAVSQGQLTPDEAASVTAILDAQARAIQIVDLDKRIRQLEEQHSEASS